VRWTAPSVPLGTRTYEIRSHFIACLYARLGSPIWAHQRYAVARWTRTALAAASTVEPVATSSANLSRRNASLGLPVFMCPHLEVESRITKYWQTANVAEVRYRPP